MRSEGNPLDLNNLPEDNNTRDDGKQASWDTSSSAGRYRKKKSGGGKDESELGGNKVYECRFCSLKFCKSQALGGHMNRHRQERETETLNKARQLVFTNDLAPVHLGFASNGQPISHGGYHQATRHQEMEIASLPPFTSMYPSPIFSTSSLITPPPVATYAYPYQAAATPAANDYFIGHALSYIGAPAQNEDNGKNYTCIGAPVVQGSANTSGSVREGLNWGRR